MKPRARRKTKRNSCQFLEPAGKLQDCLFRARDAKMQVSVVSLLLLLSLPLAALATHQQVAVSETKLEVFDEFVIAGNSVALRCQAPVELRGQLEVVGWLRDNRLLSTVELKRARAGDKYLLLGSGELLLRNATETDAAAYRCRARNRMTGAQYTSNSAGRLVVDSSRSLRELRAQRSEEQAKPQLVWAREHQEAQLCAIVQSWPAPTFSWFRREAVTASGGSGALVGVSRADGQQLDACLLIQSIQLRQAGDYVCEARSGDSTLRIQLKLLVSSASLSVHVVPLVGSSSGQLLVRNSREQPQKQVVALGSSIQLNCSISGHPYDTILWFKDSKLLASSPAAQSQSAIGGTHEQRVSLLQPTVISIERFGLRQRGSYACQVYSSSRNSSYLKEQQENEQLRGDLERTASGAIQLDAQLSKPYFTRKSQSNSLELGDRLQLECAAAGLPAPRIGWLLDGLPLAKQSAIEPDEEEEHSISDTDRLEAAEMSDVLAYWTQTGMQKPIGDERFQVAARVDMSQTSGSNLPIVTSWLNVSRAGATETGEYKCVASNPLGSIAHVVQVSVAGGLAMRSYQPSSVNLTAGRAASLQCPLVGYPLARVDWFREGKRLPVNHRQRVEPVRAGTGGRLELVNVDLEADSGTYTCRATMQANGSSSQMEVEGLAGQVRVAVQVAPQIDEQSLPELTQAREGMRTKLVCSVVQGDHPVDIRWLKRASDSSKVALVGESRLHGFELMQNSAGEGQSEDSVTVHNLEDSCLLTFKQVSRADVGDYVCLARNQAGQSVRVSRLLVNLAPAWSVEPPSELSGLLGSRLQLDCSAHGLPTPSVSWKREAKQQPRVQQEPTALVRSGIGQQQLTATNQEPTGEFSELVSSYRQRVYGNGSLVIDQLEEVDGGSFMCEVNNGVGAGLSKLVRVKINIPPHFKHRSSTHLSQVGGRAELKCLAFGDHPMIVGWRKDEEVVDLLEDSRHRTVTEHKMGLQALESILTIDSLRRNDTGQYVCVASNEFGSEPMRVQLVVQEPPEPPSLLRPIRASSRQATLAFRPPYSGNSPIRKYAISFRPVESEMIGSNFTSSSGWQQVTLDAPAPESSLEVTSNFTSDHQQQQEFQQLVNLNLCCLQPFTRYVVRVKALNEVGSSEHSKLVSLTTDEEAIGGPPLEVAAEATGAHSLKVRWSPPARNQQNGLIRGYYIGYRALPAAGNSMLSTQAPIDRAIGSNIRVFEGSESEQFQYKNVQVDSSPFGFRQLLAGTFLEASTNGSDVQQQPLTSYLTNLRKKTAYSIIVQAYNKIGAGPRSDQVVVWTLDAAPPMSPILRFLSVSSNSAQLVWSPRRFSLDSRNGSSLTTQNYFEDTSRDSEGPEEDEDDPQTYYTIHYRAEDRGISSGADDWKQRRLPRRLTQAYLLDGLRCGSHHSAFMTATNSLGQSEPGDPVHFTTLGAAPLAPANSKEFLQVNSTSVILRLAAWHNAGCTLTSFLIKFRPSGQHKWSILEHQVHPTIQTTTVSGAAVFSTRPTSGSAYEQQSQWDKRSNFLTGDSQKLAASTAIEQKASMQQQTLSDFVIRSLAPNVVYRLVVEATSEAGTTTAEYELDTANFSTSTLSISTNGLSVADLQASDSRKSTAGNRIPLEPLSPGDTDFGYSGSQHVVGSFRYSPSVWSLTALFAAASLFMGVTTLVLGLRSLLRGKPLNGSRDSLISAMLCCSSSSAASSGASSSHSSSGGTCYQVPEQSGAAEGGYGCSVSRSLRAIEDATTPTHRPPPSISGHLDACDMGELKSIMATALPFRQLVNSSSLSTIGDCRQASMARMHSNTLGRNCQRGDEEEARVRSHYAATLGRQNSTFIQQVASAAAQPIRCDLYGKVAGKYQQPQHQQLYHGQDTTYFQYPTNSSATSGYETGKSAKTSSVEQQREYQQQQPVYLSGVDEYQRMNLYGDGGNLFTTCDNQQNCTEQADNASLDPAQFQHYNEGKSVNCQQMQHQLSFGASDNNNEQQQLAYGVLFGTGSQ